MRGRGERKPEQIAGCKRMGMVTFFWEDVA